MEADQNREQKAVKPIDPDIQAYFAALERRKGELVAEGKSWSVAFETASIELRFEQNWPEAWGDELFALVYGDFDPPDAELVYPSLGIRVSPEKREGTVISFAWCVLAAHIKVEGKTLAHAIEAGARLNTLLGIWTLTDWGNRTFGWWCPLLGRSLGGMAGQCKQEHVPEALGSLEQLTPEVKRRVRAAMYWIRTPMSTMNTAFKSDTFPVYAGYWNAFECLVDAVCLLVPQQKLSKPDKAKGIAKFIADRDGKLNPTSLAECYREFGDPGFVAKASHALRVCCPDRAADYIEECFRAKPTEDRLYAIRNAINHGDIDSDDLHEMIRVDEKGHRLTMIVFALFGRLVRFPCPVDRPKASDARSAPGGNVSDTPAG